MVAPSPVDPEEASRITLALKAVALERRDRRRILRDAGRFDPVQPQPRERELDRRGDRARHAPLAGVRGSHPITERSALRHAAPHPAERDSAQKLIGHAVENEKRIGLFASHVVVLSLEAAAKRSPRQIIVRPCRLPRLKKTAARGPVPPTLPIVPERRRAQIKPIAAEHRLWDNGPRQAEQRHHTPFSARAIFAWPGALPAAPMTATGGDDLSMAAPVLRTSSTVMASTRASISSKESTRP